MRKEKLLKLQKRILRYYLNNNFCLEMGSQKKEFKKSTGEKKWIKLKMELFSVS